MEIQGFLHIIQESPEFKQYISGRRAYLFGMLHEIVFHGKGGYDYDTVYNLPIWLRKFTYTQIRKYYEDQAEAMNTNPGSQSIADAPRIPEHVKDTIAKTRKTADFTVKRKQ